MVASWKKSYDQPRKKRHYFADKGPSSQSYGFSRSHVWVWELDHKESWALKNWYFWTVVLEKTLESPLDSKEIKPVNRKGNQSWIFIGRADAEVETAILWPPDLKNWLTGKGPDAGKDWRWDEKGITEDEMFGWHDWLDGHEFEQTHLARSLELHPWLLIPLGLLGFLLIESPLKIWNIHIPEVGSHHLGWRWGLHC